VNDARIKEIESINNELNSFKDCPRWNETITAMNEKDIDYLGWNDLEIYLWSLNNMEY